MYIFVVTEISIWIFIRLSNAALRCSIIVFFHCIFDDGWPVFVIWFSTRNFFQKINKFKTDNVTVQNMLIYLLFGLNNNMLSHKRVEGWGVNSQGARYSVHRKKPIRISAMICARYGGGGGGCL